MNSDGDTMAMLFIREMKKIPPNDLKHNANIKNNKGEKVSDLIKNILEIEVPKEWCSRTRVSSRLIK